MIKISASPTFTYTLTSQSISSNSKQRAITSRATNIYNDKKRLTRATSRNLISRRKWSAQMPPTIWPKHLRYPHDMTKATLYTAVSVTRETPQKRRNKQEKRLKRKKAQEQKEKFVVQLDTDIPPCSGLHCTKRGMKTTNPQDLCRCKKTNYTSLNNDDWFEQNVILRKTPTRGIGTFALKRISRNTVLSEYVGEFLPASPTYVDNNSPAYHFGIENSNGDHLGNIDSLRVSSWTRFINHSCSPNTEFELRRVGQEAQVFVMAKRMIKAGEEILVNHGNSYWEGGEGGCGCGESVCRFKV